MPQSALSLSGMQHRSCNISLFWLGLELGPKGSSCVRNAVCFGASLGFNDIEVPRSALRSRLTNEVFGPMFGYVSLDSLTSAIDFGPISFRWLPSHFWLVPLGHKAIAYLTKGKCWSHCIPLYLKSSYILEQSPSLTITSRALTVNFTTERINRLHLSTPTR